MADPPPSEPPRKAPLEAALDVELHRFERLTVRVWQVLGSVGVIASLLIAIFIEFDLGIACAVTVAIYLAWYVVVGLRLERDSRGNWLRTLSDVVEGTIPWAFLLVMVFVQGADYGLASWVPPMLFSMLLFSQAMRLRILAPIVIGVAGGITFPLLYFLMMRDRLPEPFDAHLLYQGPMQVSRSISLVIVGCVAALGSRYLRGAIARAEQVVREQELFGKYRLLRRVARGGMGEVYEALYCPEGGFERRVAIKRVHAHLAEQDRFVDLFRGEAEISSRLAHPNIVQVMDFGRVRGSYFLAMEYVDGFTLASLMNRCQRHRTAVPEQVAGVVARDLLAGLHYAHEVARGPDGRPLRVVHRDLCPQNVLLSRNGEVKITDFGVARALKDAESSHTRTVVGHAAYAAPEQALAQLIDPRVDLFSLGIILWELLVGRRLFRRESEVATVQALMNEKVPPVTLVRPDLHKRWDELLGTALCRDPAERYQSAAEMTAVLDAIPTSRAENGSRLLSELVAELLGSDDEADDDAPTVVEQDSRPTVRLGRSG